MLRDVCSHARARVCVCSVGAYNSLVLSVLNVLIVHVNIVLLYIIAYTHTRLINPTYVVRTFVCIHYTVWDRETGDVTRGKHCD